MTESRSNYETNPLAAAVPQAAPKTGEHVLVRRIAAEVRSFGYGEIERKGLLKEAMEHLATILADGSTYTVCLDLHERECDAPGKPAGVVGWPQDMLIEARLIVTLLHWSAAEVGEYVHAKSIPAGPPDTKWTSSDGKRFCQVGHSYWQRVT